MERSSKPRGGKASKSHQPFLGSELIPLGKGSRPAEPEVRKIPSTTSSSKSSTSSSKQSSSSSSAASGSSKSGERKREITTSISGGSPSPVGVPPKKSRIAAVSSGAGSSNSNSSTGSSSSLTKSSHSSSSSSSQLKPSKSSKRDPLAVEPVEHNFADLAPDRFFPAFEKAEKLGDVDCIQGLITMAVKRLKVNKEKPELKLCIGLLAAAKTFPPTFQHNLAVESVCSLAKKQVADVKSKIPVINYLSPLAVNILTVSHSAAVKWPIDFVQLWIEDASGDRFWVDSTHCKSFVENIIFSFGTKLPASNLLLPPEPASTGPAATTPVGGSSPHAIGMGEETNLQDEISDILQNHSIEIPLMKRYIGCESQIENIILEYSKDLIHKKAPDIPRNLLRALSSACGLSGVRAYVVKLLEQWMHSPKCGRQAQELLLHLCVNADCLTSVDAEIVTQIPKLRMKTKPLLNFYAISVREMVKENEGNLRNVLNQLIYNELSPTRNPNNLTLLGTILGQVPESSTVLADIFMDLLQKREDFLQGLKLLLREIARASRFECDLSLFGQGLMKHRDINWKDGDVRERTFSSVADLVLCSMFLSVSGQVREAALVRGDSKDLGVLSAFQKQIAGLQQDAIFWLYSVACKMYRPPKKDFVTAMHKILLKDPMTELVSKDGWPAESEKSLFVRLCLEAPLLENTLIWLMQMGLSKEHPCASSEIIELVDHIICRAATHKGVIILGNLEIIDMLFKLCQYKHPDNITLPVGYEPPKLAISKYYWRVWIVLTILCAHNPVTYGKLGWDTYPALKGFMEMCMTNHFTYPPASSADSKDEDHAKEIMIASMEKQNILAFETHLAAASSKTVITEKTSLLLAQLMNLDPFGIARTPPAAILSQLQASNDQMHLGHLLCRSRNPDFLLDLIQRNSHPMPWLSELVSEGSFEILPVQCLCEFMLGQTDRMMKAIVSESADPIPVSAVEKSPRKPIKAVSESTKEDMKSLQLLQYLQKTVHGTSEDAAREVLEYFLRRLSSQKMLNRSQALQGLQMLFSSPGILSDNSWLMDSLPTLRIFPDIQDMIIAFLRQAIQVESEPEWITRYLEFLSVWGNLEADSEMDNLAMDVAQLVVERNVVITALLAQQQKAFDAVFDIFLNYMKRIQEPHKETYKWSESQDQVLVQWPKDKLEATMNILVVHGIVILLTSYASLGQKLKPKKSKSATTEMKYNELIEMWFPKSKDNTPKGYLLNTSEEAVLYPDWIKLRMIRSNNSRLLSAALQDLDSDQLMLFVQSFGVPVQSMTALLFCLDKAIEESSEKVSSAIMDAPYMRQLIELQWKRGATGGERFDRLLKGITDEQQPMDTSNEVKVTKIKVRPQLILPESEEDKGFLKTPQNTGSSRKLSLSFHTPKSESKDIQTPEKYLREARGGDKNIRTLSKELLALSSPQGSRRRSSVPVDPNIIASEDSLNGSTPRRHSSHLEPRDGQDSKLLDTVANIGYLVDTITDIEPCIVRNALDVQLPLLFGRQDTTPYCRSFLLSVLTHQAGWETVEHCINLFLKSFDGCYDPSGILDLISATITNPKLWQGCDKYVPKHQPNMSVFHLTQPQLLVMAEYIVEEISQLEMKSTKFSITNLLGNSQSVPPKNAKKFKCNLQDRVRLWLQCCHQDKEIVDTTIRSLMDKKAKNPCAKKFVSQVYLEFPEVILIDSWKTKSEEMNLNEEDITCVLDTISHVLITQVANVQPGKDWAKKASHEYEICLRKLAAVHPTLLLRQLPLMGSLLEGRVHLDFSVFYAQNHHIPFLVYLGLLDLMQPHVLKHFKSLKATLLLYLKLFTNYGHLKDHSASLSRFAVLLHNFLSVNTTEVKEFLTPHYGSLRELASVKYYVDVSPLQNLMTFLVPPSATSELSIPAPPVGSSDMGTFASETTSAIIDRILHASNDDEMVPILQELDSASNRNPSILSQFDHSLNPLLLSNNDSCRTLAFTLILKHVTYCPSAGKLYLESVLQALQARNAQIKDNLLDRIHEFIILAQEHADMILIRLFELGVSSNINVLPSITKTLSLLRSCVGVL